MRFASPMINRCLTVCLAFSLHVAIGLSAIGGAASAAQAGESSKPIAAAGMSEWVGPGAPLVQGLPWLVWYPSAEPERPTREGRTTFDAARDALPLPGRHPLVVLSHGSGGSSMTHWETARYLARRGYVVLAIVHRDDNAFVSSGSSTLAVWQSRPKEMSAALDALLASRYAAVIDSTRIAAVGFSAGAYTALAVGGARASSRALDDYCLEAARPDVLCVDYRPLRRLRVAIARRLGMQGESLIAPRDMRVRAVVAMAPPGVALFTPQGLKGLAVPTLLLEGDHDSVLAYPDDARYLKAMLGDRAEYRTVPGGHLVFASIALAPPQNASAAIDAARNEAALREANEAVEQFLTHALDLPRQPQ
jgi:predicted dienelactone hydrolase